MKVKKDRSSQHLVKTIKVDNVKLIGHGGIETEDLLIELILDFAPSVPVQIFATQTEVIMLCREILDHCDMAKIQEINNLLNETLLMLKLSGKG